LLFKNYKVIYRHILIFFLLVFSFNASAQVELDIEESFTAKDTVRLIKETSDGTMMVELSDLSDLSDVRIDSLLRILDAKTSSDYSSIYGHSFFRNKFSLVDKELGRSIVKIPDNYVLGYGDEISVSIFGTSQFLGKYVVDQKGFIYPDEIPSIYLFGLEFGQAKEVIRKVFSRFFIFRREQISISLDSPRDIVVNVFGEAKKPGSYNISALNTSFQALFNAGGPNKSGSVRNIKVITDGFESTLDIYELMANPTSNNNLGISDNTLISIPVAQKVVRIEGAIKRPMSYELKENEGLKELIFYAGGLRSSAYLKNLSVSRFDVDKMRLIDVDLQPILNNTARFDLQNGDVIRVKRISPALDEVVYVRGAVKHPGPYELEATPTIADLLRRAELLREARMDNVFIKRQNYDGTQSIITVNAHSALLNKTSVENITLDNKDEVVIDSLSVFTDTHTIKVSGAVRREIEHSYDASGKMTVRTAVNLAGGIKQDAADLAYILRTDQVNKTKKEYIRFDIKDILKVSLGKADLALLPDDELIVLNNTESDDPKFIQIGGAVRRPSEMVFADNLTIADLVLLAGGLKVGASGAVDIFSTTYEKRTDEFRTGLKTVVLSDDLSVIGDEPKLSPGDKLIFRKLDDLTSKSYVHLKGEFNQVGEFALINNNERVSDLISRAGGLTDEAFLGGAYIIRDSTRQLIVELDQVLSAKGGSQDFILQDADMLIVPKKQNLVYISTAYTKAAESFKSEYENSVIGVPYSYGKSGEWYLENYAGGPASFADPSQVIIKSANGAVKKSRKRLWLFKKHPVAKEGDLIGYASKLVSPYADQEKSMRYPNLRKGVIIHLDKENKMGIDNVSEGSKPMKVESNNSVKDIESNKTLK
jgi:protein involved in polysaccharide export with SLBB domain